MLPNFNTFCVIFAEDEIENLKSTSTMKSMVRAIKMEYDIDARTYGLFNLQFSDGEEFYKDKEIESSTW